MKKLKKLKLQSAVVLDKPQMMAVRGGYNGGDDAPCWVRCDQDNSEGQSASNCNRSTVESICGDDLSNAVCTGGRECLP